MITSEFTGGVFSDRIDGGRAGAIVKLSPTGVTALGSDGQRFTVPFGQCQIEIGGNSGRMVFCRSRDRSLTIFCEDHAFPSALATSSMGMLDAQIECELAKRKKHRSIGRRVAVLCMIGLVLLIVGGYYGLLLAARAAVQAVPVAVDREIGKRTMQVMDLGGEKVEAPIVVEGMQQIVDRLEPHAAIDGLEFDVQVITSPQVNAFAIPGGKIVVYTGLIEKARSGEEVAAVLAHEMAHATLRHGLERISHSIGLSVAISFLLGDTHGLIMAGSEAFQLATINSYSRQHESAADAEGVRMLHAAGIDPLAMARFFETLHEEHGDMPDAFSWISTHPANEVRIEIVKQQVAELPKKQFEPLDIDWAAVQRAVADDNE